MSSHSLRYLCGISNVPAIYFTLVCSCLHSLGPDGVFEFQVRNIYGNTLTFALTLIHNETNVFLLSQLFLQ